MLLIVLALSAEIGSSSMTHELNAVHNATKLILIMLFIRAKKPLTTIMNPKEYAREILTCDFSRQIHVMPSLNS